MGNGIGDKPEDDSGWNEVWKTQRKIKMLKILVALAVGLVIGWALASLFLPAPVPPLAH